VAASVRAKLVNSAAELKLRAQGFALDHDTYHDGYIKIHALYEQVSNARQYLQAEATDLRKHVVSDQIRGIKQGADQAQRALDGRAGSLLAALLDVETQLSKLLTNMHHSYVTYTRTDQEAAFNLITAPKTP